MNYNISPEFVILGMAFLTYLTRASGFFIAEKTGKLPSGVEKSLGFIPGTIIISIIAPAVFAHGYINLAASIVCLLVSLKSNNIVVVMITGVLFVALLRNYPLI